MTATGFLNVRKIHYSKTVVQMSVHIETGSKYYKAKANQQFSYNVGITCRILDKE